MDEQLGAAVEVEANGGDATATETKKRARRSAGLSGLAGNRFKLWQRIELGLLGVVIVVVWILLALPFIFYHIPMEENGNNTFIHLNATSPTESVLTGATPDEGGTLNMTAPNDTDPNANSTACPRGSATLYTGECVGELADLQSCLTTSDDVFVMEGLDFTQLDSLVGDLKAGLGLLGASPECERAAIPFFCLYLFGLCGETGVLHQPSYSDCITISTDTCTKEWAIASTQLPLPQCESFPATADPICEGTANVTVEDAALNCSSSADCPNPCSEGFYCSSGVCLPRCDQWREYSPATVVATDSVIIVTASTGLISGIIVLVISCIRWKKMFVFPSINIVYLTVTLMVLALFVLISFLDRDGLFCSSCDLVLARSEPTAFCIISGMVFYYVILQIAIWWFCHVLTLFWKIRFPFHTKRFETAHYFKYVHITTVVLTIIVPAIPIIAEFGVGGSKGAFGQTQYPPIVCTGLNGDIAFYGIVLPVIILLQIGITMLIIIFWSIHKQFRNKQSKSPFKFGTAEKKILVVFCYYVVFSVSVLTAFTLGARTNTQLANKFSEYFICEATPDPDNPCPRAFSEHAQPEFSSIANALVGLFPVANLVYTIDIREVKAAWASCKFRVYARPSVSTSA